MKVAALPPGRDPGDLWRDDPDVLVKAVEGAQRFMQFKMGRVLAAADLTGPEGRARAAEALVPVLREHPNELVREQYIQTAAGTLGIDHAWFKQAIASGRRRAGATTTDEPRARDEEPSAGAAPVAVDPREEDVLRWAIHDPELVRGLAGRDRSSSIRWLARLLCSSRARPSCTMRWRRAREMCARCSSGSPSRSRRPMRSRRRCARGSW